MTIKFSSLGILALTCVCSGCSVGKLSAISNEACDIALGYAEDFKAKSGIPVAMKHSPSADEMSIIEPEFIDIFLRKHSEFKSDPMIPLERKIAATRDVSAVTSCPKLENWYNTNSVVYDDRRYDELAKNIPDLYQPDRKLLKISMLEISLPAISDDGETAYFRTVEATQTTGGWFAITYNKSAKGEWRMTRKDSVGGVP